MISTLISNDFSLKGDIEHNGDMRIEGKIEGNISNEKGILILCENSIVHGDIQADKIILAGNIKGNIKASTTIEILPTAKVIGNIVSSSVNAKEGFVFKGQIEIKDENKQS